MSKFVRAEEFCSLVTDGTHDSPKKMNSGIRLVTSKNIVGGKLDLSNAYFISKEDADFVNKRSKVHINDILISMIGTVGEVCLIDKEPDFVIKNVGLFKLDSLDKSKWLYFYLKSENAKNLIRERLKGTTQQYISLGELRKFPILLPQNEEHLNYTVNFLWGLEEKIQLNTQINQTLEQIAQAIFKSWFIDFDPVKAKAKAQGATDEQANIAAMSVISGKSPDQLNAYKQTNPTDYQQLHQLAQAFPSEFEEIDGVEVPKGWEFKFLKDCCVNIKNGGTPKRSNTEYWQDGVIPWLSSGEVCNNKILVSSKEFITQLGLNNSSAKLIPSNSTLIALYASPTAGKCSFCAFESTTNQAICALQPKEYFDYFNYYSLQQKEEYFANRAVGSAQQNISKAIVEQTSILVPSNFLLESFHNWINPFIGEQIDRLKENKSLAEIRDLLLPKLLNGEI